MRRDERRRLRDGSRDEHREERRQARAARPAPPPERDSQTRQRLLEVAAELFADRGLEGVSVRELCAAAGANVAAVNYHFGGKLGLYSELIEQAIQGMRRTLSVLQQAGTAEERLGAYIHGEIDRALTARPGSWVQRLMSREMDAPTAVLDRVVREAIKPRVEHVSRLVAELMRCPVGDPRVGVAVANIHGLPALIRRQAVYQRLAPDFRATPEVIRAMAEMTTRFVLAGLRELATKRPAGKP